MAFKFARLGIPDVILIETPIVRDERGLFRELYKESEFSANGITAHFVQDNGAQSVRGVLRGLHYQKHPKAQGKLVAVTDGSIWDVAVDIRKGSPTYGTWVAAELSLANGLAVYVPPGFAHGYCVTSERAAIVYKVTADYAPELERGIIWNDPTLAISWPVSTPVLSPRDARLPRLEEADNKFVYESQPT